MENVFIHVVDRSFETGLLVLVILFMRTFYKKMPKWGRCLLWGLVGIKLIFPFTVKSGFSMLPDYNISSVIYKTDNTAVPADSGQGASVVGESDDKAGDFDSDNHESGIKQNVLDYNDASADNQAFSNVKPVQTTHKETRIREASTDRLVRFAAYIWIAGMAAMSVYMLSGVIRLQIRLSDSARMRDNIWINDRIETAFVLGIIKPRIYISSNIKSPAFEYVVAHENAHIRRLDYLWKPLGFVLLLIHWFNPLMWAAYAAFCKDIEYACDEFVIKDFDAADRKAYADALLICGAFTKGSKNDMIYPVAFGEAGVKDRILKVVKYSRPSYWTIALTILVTAAAVLCFMTKPAAYGMPGADGSAADGNSSDGNAVVNSSEADGLITVPPSVGEGAKKASEVPNGGVFSLDMVLEMVKNKSYWKYDFTGFDNAVKNSNGASVRFVYEYNEDTFYVNVSYADKSFEEANFINIRRKSNNDVITLWSVRDNPGTYMGVTRYVAEESDVIKFLDHAYRLSDDITYRVPDALTESPYDRNTGGSGGSLLLPMAYEYLGTSENADYIRERLASGSIVRVSQDYIQWNEGQMVYARFPYNHMSMEEIGVIEGLSAPAYLAKVSYDIYTAAEAEELKNQGIDINSICKESEYWCVFMARQEDDYAFALSLNCKDYTSQDAIEFAKTVNYVK